MFSSNQEFYNYIDALCEKLRAAGEPAWAAGIKDAKLGGSTGGEVLGRLLLKLQELGRSEVPTRLGVRDEIRAVTRDLERTLRKWR